MSTRRGSARHGAVGMITIRTPLDKDEEDIVHARMARGRDAAATLSAGVDIPAAERTRLRREVNDGRAAEEELLAGTCALVKKRVNDLGFPFDQDELESAGLEGLVTALRRFDPHQGTRFATYANYWISKMVFTAISHRVTYPEADIRLVIKLRRHEHQHPQRSLSPTEAAKVLGVSRTEAARIMRLSSDIAAGLGTLDHDSDMARVPDDTQPWPEAEWVIDGLKDILGKDFTDFWMWTGRVMSLEELGRRHGISKQAMAKRVAKWRRAVETSEHADQMLAWLRAQ